MRFILLSLGIASIVVLGLTIDSQSRSPARRSAPKSTPYSSSLIHAPGRIEGATPEIELRPPISGTIVQVSVRQGQFVGKDDVLLIIDDAQYRENVALAAAEFRMAEARLAQLISGAHPQERAEASALLRARQAELRQAQLAWERIRQLREANAVAEQEADDQRSLVQSLTAQVAAAEARVRLLESPPREEEVQLEEARVAAAKSRWQLANVQLSKTRLQAPVTGQILQVNVDDGELAGPDSAQPAVILADISKYQVRAFVDEFDAPRIRTGMSAKVTADGLPGQEIQGHVTRLSPRMGRKQIWTDDPAERLDTKTREVWIALDSSDELVVGLRVDVLINLNLVKYQNVRVDESSP